MLSAERLRFEAWNLENFGGIDLTRADNGEYRSARTRSDWELWQAASAATGTAAPEIDLLRQAADALREYRSCQGNGWPPAGFDAHVVDLLTRIDASPKGGSFRNDGGSSVVSEYIAARDAYEEAIKPSGGFGQPKRLCHSSPILLRYRNARSALDAMQAASAEVEG